MVTREIKFILMAIPKPKESNRVAVIKFVALPLKLLKMTRDTSTRRNFSRRAARYSNQRSMRVHSLVKQHFMLTQQSS